MQKLKLTKEMLLSEVKDYIFITLGLLCYSLGWAAFLIPYQITTGGTTGISAIILYATGFPIQWSYFIINAVLMGFAFKLLGPRFTIRTTFAIFMLTFQLWLLQEIINGPDGIPPILLGEGQDFMACLIGATLCGIGLGVAFNHNGSTGGTDIIAAVVRKYRDVTMGNMIMACDVVIITSCYFIFHDWRRVIFGFVTLFVVGVVLDYVMNRARQSVQFFIFSKKYEEIADHINRDARRGVTVLHGQGWYSKQDVKVLVVLASKRQSAEIFQLVKWIDPNAFVSQSSVIGVYGEGFDQIKGGNKKKLKKIFSNKKIVFATNNKHKLEEVSAMLGDQIELLSLNDINCHDDIQETADTLEGNALIKARYIANKYHCNCFADDTGLEVEALDGAPGVRSARYASENHDSQANMAKLLKELEGVENRKAQFRTVFALIIDGKESLFEGIVKGKIITEKKGNNGFGYDPVFVPDGYDKTFAELGNDVKNVISHRAKATENLCTYLKDNIN